MARIRAMIGRVMRRVHASGPATAAAAASPSLNFSSSANSMYIFPMTGIGVN
jgi:hypothetical protein